MSSVHASLPPRQNTVSGGSSWPFFVPSAFDTLRLAGISIRFQLALFRRIRNIHHGYNDRMGRYSDVRQGAALDVTCRATNIDAATLPTSLPIPPRACRMYPEENGHVQSSPDSMRALFPRLQTLDERRRRLVHRTGCRR